VWIRWDGGGGCCVFVLWCALFGGGGGGLFGVALAGGGCLGFGWVCLVVWFVGAGVWGGCWPWFGIWVMWGCVGLCGGLCLLFAGCLLLWVCVFVFFSPWAGWGWGVCGLVVVGAGVALLGRRAGGDVEQLGTVLSLNEN